MGDKTNLKTFEDLECWKACRDLRKFAATITKKLPREEGYRLKDQILRAARSTTANIAECYGRFHYRGIYNIVGMREGQYAKF